MKETNFNRCEDCSELAKDKNGCYICKECFNQLIAEIDDCPLGVSVEEIEELNKKAKENPVKLKASAIEKKERKPRERKADPTKENFIKNVAEYIESFAENVTITNISKIIEFDLENEHYKLDLIRQRKPKK